MITRPATVLFVSLLAFAAAQAAPLPQDAPSKPDNTKVNRRDRNRGEATADSQKMNASDRALAARIRKEVVADKALSTYAHNIKIICQDGMVTLKGPVRSEEEIKSLMAIAIDAAGGSDKVVNRLAVKQ